MVAGGAYVEADDDLELVVRRAHDPEALKRVLGGLGAALRQTSDEGDHEEKGAEERRVRADECAHHAIASATGAAATGSRGRLSHVEPPTFAVEGVCASLAESTRQIRAARLVQLGAAAACRVGSGTDIGVGGFAPLCGVCAAAHIAGGRRRTPVADLERQSLQRDAGRRAIGTDL